MSTPSTTAPDKAPKGPAAALREENKRLKSILQDLVASTRGMLLLFEDGKGNLLFRDHCPKCLGALPINSCYHCRRIRQVLDDLKAAGA